MSLSDNDEEQDNDERLLLIGADDARGNRDVEHWSIGVDGLRSPEPKSQSQKFQNREP